ncbi:type II toxin-antitoxin system RelE/ParE family toxin [Nitrosomonas sp.]|uniref:type II toxin-antitoxin system RelE family toxin n=1 Tax=Nitrosomonas sp. TaxID=42353 RepID=UPI0025F34EDE|nr:type II toxin-antitoxin system RelE/ParE family toxin [Nitrosomonas sp.]
MTYSITIRQSAVKSLQKIPKPDRLRIIEAIDLLKEHPGAGSALKGEFSGLRRIRVGMYRVVYEIQNGLLTILVVRISHRRDVYR